MPDPTTPTSAVAGTAAAAPGERRRRVLVVTPDVPYPPSWGFGIRVFQLARGLSRRHDVTLMCHVAPDGAEQLAALREHLDNVVAVTRPPSRTLVRRLEQARSLASRVPHHAAGTRSAELQAAVDAVVAGGVDLVQLESSQLGWLRLPPEVPVVVDEHNIESDLLARVSASERSGLRRRWNRIQARRFARFESDLWGRVDACVATSDSDAAGIRARAPQLDVTVVPNAVDVDRFRPSGQPRTPDTLVFVGLQSYRPNFDGITWFMDEVLPLIRAHRPQVRLTVVGDGPERTLEALRRPGVTVTGWVPDVRPYLASAAAVVVPLRMGGGTRLKVLDAMATGSPVASTSLGSEGIDVVDGEHLLLADDAAALAAATIRLLQEPELAQRLGSAARDLAVARYSWETAVEGLDRVHDAVLAARAEPTPAASTQPADHRGVQ